MFLFIEKDNEGHLIFCTFKYISCSYLSQPFYLRHRHLMHLNTSHVLIYRVQDGEISVEYKDLNTSHVLIYRRYPNANTLKRI